jgi:ATP-binding cassette subfamily B protein
LYSTVSFVLQDAQLLRMSVRDNIALSRPEASLEDIRKAAKAATIDDEIMALPKGYDTIVNQDVALSGGQEHRIAIARALIVDAPILILDEATASVDPESEAEIQEALNNLVRDRTVIVIAHKPTSIVGADQIVVLERGRITACGTHEELKDEAHYAALWSNAQIDDGDIIAVNTATTEQGAKR